MLIGSGDLLLGYCEILCRRFSWGAIQLLELLSNAINMFHKYLSGHTHTQTYTQSGFNLQLKA